MKKICMLLFAFILGISSISAQNFDEVEAAFATFAADLASALPFASTIGLNWSDSYIGNFPHLGVAVTGGSVGLPADAFGRVLGTLTNSGLGGDLANLLPPEIADITDQTEGGVRVKAHRGFVRLREHPAVRGLLALERSPRVAAGA